MKTLDSCTVSEVSYRHWLNPPHQFLTRHSASGRGNARRLWSILGFATTGSHAIGASELSRLLTLLGVQGKRVKRALTKPFKRGHQHCSAVKHRSGIGGVGPALRSRSVYKLHRHMQLAAKVSISWRKSYSPGPPPPPPRSSPPPTSLSPASARSPR